MVVRESDGEHTGWTASRRAVCARRESDAWARHSRHPCVRGVGGHIGIATRRDGISLTSTMVPSGLGREPEDQINNLTSILDADFTATGFHMNVNVLNRDMLIDARDYRRSIRARRFACPVTRSTSSA